MITLALLSALTAPMAAEESFYIGTYTSANGSQGIYRATLNVETGQLSVPALAARCSSPSFLAFGPEGHSLYAIDEASSGVVSAYSVKADGSLGLLNSQSWDGSGACHLSVTPSGKDLLVAVYGGGSVASFPIQAGSLQPLSGRFQNAGTGPNKDRQEGPHLHSIVPDAQSRFSYACDLGTDEILTLPIGKTPLEPVHRQKVAPGSGPRHLAFGRNGKFLYANMELSNQVTAFAVDSAQGTLAAVQSLSTLPTDRTTKPNTTAEIACHPNGKWLYVSNRGEDSIAAYQIGRDGKLTLIEIASASVREPRSFAIDTSGKWMVVAGQNSNDLASLSIDPKTGRLKPSTSRVPISTPVCVVFQPR